MSNIEGKILVNLLKEIYGAKNNLQLSKTLRCSYLTIRNWERAALSKTILKNALNAILNKHNNCVDGDKFIAYGKRKYQIKTDLQIAHLFGTTQPALVNWRRSGLTIRSIYDVIEKSKELHLTNSITPLVEFYPINRTDSKQEKAYEIIGAKPLSLKKLLKSHNGIYLFYDSRGHAIYSGKPKSRPFGGK